MRGGLQKTAVWAAQGEVFSAPFGRRSRSARFAAGLCAGLAAAREFIDDFKTPINKKYFCRGGFGRRRGGFGRRGAAVSARRGAAVSGGAALSLRSVRRRGLCRTVHRVLRRSFRVPDFAPDFYAGRAPELLIFL